MPDPTHLNLRPSPDWFTPFSVSALISMSVALLIDQTDDSVTLNVGGAIWSSLLSGFELVIFTSMWIALRGSGRQFLPAMRLRVSIVGLLAPVVICGVWLLLCYIGYGTPTQASPGLETMAISSMLLGEILLSFASFKQSKML